MLHSVPPSYVTYRKYANDPVDTLVVQLCQAKPSVAKVDNMLGPAKQDANVSFRRVRVTRKRQGVWEGRGKESDRRARVRGENET